MTYVKTDWETGDIITAEKLNHMESGVENANSGTYVKTDWETGDIITAEKLNHMESGIENANSGGGRADLDALINRSITSVQSNVEIVGEYAFRGCNNLLTADLPNAISIGSNAFYSCTGISNVNLPKVKEIGSFCFQSTTFKSVLLPKIEKIESNCFANCSKLKYVYLGPNASSIARSAFPASTQEELVIDCGFSSGAVSGAPWGATNATINYDVPAPNPPAGI